MASRKRKALLFLLADTPVWVLDQIVDRKHWIHPMNKDSERFGEFQHLFTALKQDEDRFKSYFRMTLSTFEYILNLVKDEISKQNTAFRNAIGRRKACFDSED